MALDTSPARKFRRPINALGAARLLADWLRPVFGSSERAEIQSCLTQLLSAQTGSFHTVARRAQFLPSPSVLNKLWRRWRASRTFQEWETAWDRALRAPWQTTLQGETVSLISDYHAVPYWGEVTTELADHVRRGPAANGTTHFLVYATVAAVWRGVRVQIGLTAVGRDDSVDAVLTRLWERIAPLQLRVLAWLLDRGFYAAGVVALHETHGVPYLIAVPRRGAKQGIAKILGDLEQQYGFLEARPPDQAREYTVEAMHRRIPPQTVPLIIGWEPVSPKEEQRAQQEAAQAAKQAAKQAAQAAKQQAKQAAQAAKQQAKQAAQAAKQAAQAAKPVAQAARPAEPTPAEPPLPAVAEAAVAAVTPVEAAAPPAVAEAAAPTKPRRQRTLRRSKVQPGQKWRAVGWLGGGRNWTGKKAQRAYPSRNGIESSFRMAERIRGRTSCHDPGWRLSLFALSMLLQNAWVWLLTEGQRTLRRGWDRWRDKLPFMDFCAWIVRALEPRVGHRLAVVLPAMSPRSGSARAPPTPRRGPEPAPPVGHGVGA
jgi:hypothetical protein